MDYLEPIQVICSDRAQVMDCSILPIKPCPNADLSGIGVVVGYTANAGIVVIIIVVNYILAFQPEEDPFTKDQPSATSIDETDSFKPNPIDIFVIRSLRSHMRMSSDHRKKLKKMLMKCTLYMSDLQTITGLSLLISGFVQIKKGISAYHWKVLVYLVWFSTVTHFACLSFLRNYFFNHPSGRNWRVALMVITSIMLMVALVPTGLMERYNGSWRYGDLHPSTRKALICKLRTKLYDYDEDEMCNMILSLLILAFGLTSRLIRLFPQSSGSAKSRLRKPCSSWAMRLLNRVEKWCNIQRWPMGWRRLLIYRPLLAWFLFLRSTVDLYTSTLGEVLYIVLTFIWGADRLIKERSWSSDDENQWSFGQVVLIVLIGAPIFSFYGYFASLRNKSSETSARPQRHQEPDQIPLLQREQDRGTPILSLSFSEQAHIARDDPEYDYYKAFMWFRLTVLLNIVVIVLIFSLALRVPILNSSIVYLLPIVLCCIFSIHFYMLIALLLEHNNKNDPEAPWSRWFARVTQLALFVLTKSVLVVIFVLIHHGRYIDFYWSLYALAIPFGTYCFIVAGIMVLHQLQMRV